MKKIAILFQVLMVASICAIAQPNTPGAIGDPNTTAQPEFLKVKDSWSPSLRPDGAIDRVAHVNPVVPWANIRENDVLWRKRLWRLIDTRIKQNTSQARRSPLDSDDATFCSAGRPGGLTF